MVPSITRVCKKRGEEKDIEQYRIHTKYKNSEIKQRRGTCIDCDRESCRIRNVKRYNEDFNHRKRVLEYIIKRNREKGVIPLAEYKKKVCCGLTKAEQRKRWRINNLDKVKEQEKKYYLKYKENGKMVLDGRKYRARKKNDPIRSAKTREYFREVAKQRRENLTDIYIKSTLVLDTNLKHSDIPQELVELQRKQLKLKRDAKKQKENNSK